MTDFVIDASVTMAWCFQDESSPYADAVLDSLASQKALAPALWPLEVCNVLLAAERRNRITPVDSERFLKLLAALPIQVENLTTRRMLDAVLRLAQEQNLSSYDAAYLDLSLQNNLKIATTDRALQEAAERTGVEVYLSSRL